MQVHSLLIINKSGGLVYQSDYSNKLNKLKANDYLVLAGTLHGVFTIATQLTPKALQISASNLTNQSISNTKTLVPAHTIGALPQPSSFKNITSQDFHSSNTSGLKMINTREFNMYVYQTLTGIKFVMATDTVTDDLNKTTEIAEHALRKVYMLYSDFVMKNPFYDLDMPIRGEQFDQKLMELVKSM